MWCSNDDALTCRRKSVHLIDTHTSGSSSEGLTSSEYPTDSEGLTARRHFFNSRSDPPPPTHFLVDMPELVLNFFMYNKEFCLQKEGTAKGAAFAPDYTC